MNPPEKPLYHSSGVMPTVRMWTVWNAWGFGARVKTMVSPGCACR